VPVSEPSSLALFGFGLLFLMTVLIATKAFKRWKDTNIGLERA
jgi:hypothetical protein